MQVHALNRQNVPAPALAGGGFMWERPGAAFRAAWAVGPADAGGREVAALVAASLLLHGLLAYHLTRRSHEAVAPHEQQVTIEVLRPPPMVLPPPAPARPEKPPVVVAHRAERRVVPRLEPVAPRPEKPAASDLPALPEGDDPALAMASGTGAGDAAPPPAEAPPPPLPPAPTPVRAAPPPVVAAHEGANYLKNPRPAYPELALRKSWEGEVLLRVQVDPGGRPGEIVVERSSGREVLDEAAKEAVRGWSFVPARVGNKAIGGWVTVPIVFHLQ